MLLEIKKDVVVKSRNPFYISRIVKLNSKAEQLLLLLIAPVDSKKKSILTVTAKEPPLNQKDGVVLLICLINKNARGSEESRDESYEYDLLLLLATLKRIASERPKGRF